MGAIAELERLFAAMDAGKPVAEVMRDDERTAGRRIVLPGDEPWLPADDWHHSVVVSVDKRRVRLVAIIAKQPGTGAFTRTVAGIVAAGLKPVVIEPTREFRETLKRRGWRGTTVGHGFHSEERWSPSSPAVGRGG